MTTRKPDFDRIAAVVAGLPSHVRVERTWEAARTISSRFNGRVLLVFVHAVGRIGPDGTTPLDIDALAAKSGLAVTVTEALLSDLVSAGFLLLGGAVRRRRFTFPFMARRPIKSPLRDTVLRPPPSVAASCMQH